MLLIFSNIISTKSNLKSPFELLKLHDNLKTFGEVVVVTTKDKIQAKLTKRGTYCMFVGFTEHHSSYVYRILNLTTNSIINSRYIIWLNKTFAEWKNNKTTISTAEDDTIELPTSIEKRKLITNAKKDAEYEGNDSDKKVFRAMRKLESRFNPQATKEVEDYNHGRKMTLDQVNLALFSTEIVKEPTSYEASIKSEQKEDRIKWKNRFNKDLKEMEKRGVWEIIDKKASKINGYSK
jgi:hypothetical protein